MRKATTWALRAAGLLLPLLCAAGADAMPGGGDFCTEEPVLRIVRGMTFDGEVTTGVCHYSCEVTDVWRWTCWGWERDPIQNNAAAPGLESTADAGPESFTAGPGPQMCGLVPVSTGDASDTYTVPKDRPKGGESWCPEPNHAICCEDWYGACSY